MHTSPRKAVALILTFWFVAAFAVSLSGIFEKVQGPGVQLTIGAQMLVFFIAFALSTNFRRYLLSLTPGPLTLFHIWRVLPGAAFLYFYQLGRLPYNFAVLGGYGDILVAITAPLAAMLPRAKFAARWKLLLLWQILALGDLAMVIRAGASNATRDPSSMRPLTQFPLSLLPTILVPLALMVHLIAIAVVARKNLESARSEI